MLRALTLALTLATSPALAVQTCVTVWADDRPTSWEIENHEYAHCNGWTHGGRHFFLFGRAHRPPAKYLKGYPGKLDPRPMSSEEARKVCDGHLGCQWFE